MKIRSIVVTSTAVLLVLIFSLWTISQTKMFALQDMDKQFVATQVETVESSVDEMKGQVTALNSRLEALEELNTQLSRFNEHVHDARDIGNGLRDNITRYEGVANSLIQELQKLNNNLVQMHADQAELLGTIKKLEKRLSPFLGSDD